MKVGGLGRLLVLRPMVVSKEIFCWASASKRKDWMTARSETGRKLIIESCRAYKDERRRPQWGLLPSSGTGVGLW